MNYKKELSSIFIDNELFTFMLNELKNRQKIDFFINLGSVLYSIRKKCGLKRAYNYIHYNIKNDVNYEDLVIAKMFFNLIKKGMKISYKISIEHYKILFELNNVYDINKLIDECIYDGLNLDDLWDRVQVLKNAK